MKDYYAILGVTPQAEDIVIKAAFRALAQRYHPDRFAGSVEEATRRMSEINDAYSTLSDPVKRAAYDSEYQQSGGNEGDFNAGDQAADEGVQQLNADWSTAVEYYPDLVDLEAELARTSKSLAFTFRLLMISEKQFKIRRHLAETLQTSFLTTYFGENPEIIRFAKHLILKGHKDAAKALNEAVRVLGDDLESETVINRIGSKFGISESSPTQKVKDRNLPIKAPYSLWFSATKPDASIDDIRKLINATGGEFRIVGNRYEISWYGTGGAFRNRDEILAWFRNGVQPHLAPI